MHHQQDRATEALVRELSAEELEAVAGGGLWHWLKKHFHKDKQKVEWGGTAA